MNILWLSWKDRGHPLAGGAETVSGEIMDRLQKAGHDVKLITARYPHSIEREIVNGIEIFRSGNRYSVYLRAKKVYRDHLKDWPDVVIDEMNTLPFFSASYTSAPNILLCYQLAREVWLHQMIPPLSYIGYLSEPLMLKMLAKKYPRVATESESTKKDMQKYGFSNVQVFRVGIDLPRLKSLPDKHERKLVLSLGAIRPMKRTLDAVKAFEVARDSDPELSMIIAGSTSGSYAKKVIGYVKKSRHAETIDIKGRVSFQERLRLMGEATVILVTSVKEGWGLIVTEANSQGMPAIVYDTDGLRDSVKDKETGILCASGEYKQMGSELIKLLSDTERYETLRKNAWEYSKEFTFENSYSDFLKIITN